MSEKPLRPVRPGPLAEGRATDPYRVGVDPASPAVPTTGPGPVTTLSTPGGRPHSWAIRANASADAGTSSDGLTTAALPQNTAGNAFHAMLGSGVLKLITRAATPSGCRTVSTVRFAPEPTVSMPRFLIVTGFGSPGTTAIVFGLPCDSQ